MDSLQIVPELEVGLNHIIHMCLASHLKIEVEIPLISCCRQAAMFSRQTKDLVQARQSLCDRGFDFLAELLLIDRGNKGEYRNCCSSRLPGDSWHNYGEAASITLLKSSNSSRGMQILAAAVKHAGLVWGGLWSPDLQNHVQLRNFRSPLSRLSPSEARKLLEEVGSL